MTDVIGCFSCSLCGIDGVYDYSTLRWRVIGLSGALALAWLGLMSSHEHSRLPLTLPYSLDLVLLDLLCDTYLVLEDSTFCCSSTCAFLSLYSCFIHGHDSVPGPPYSMQFQHFQAERSISKVYQVPSSRCPLVLHYVTWMRVRVKTVGVPQNFPHFLGLRHKYLLADRAQL